MALLVAGTVIQISYRSYINILGALLNDSLRTFEHSHAGDDFLAAPIILIAVGSAIAVFGFFGCCGAIRENYCMTMTVNCPRALFLRFFC